MIITERERELIGVPIGNLTSQLFANVYLDSFDHFVKERLGVKRYLRYTDDFILLHDDPVELVSLLPPMRAFLRNQLRLELHPRKVILRKLGQGIDFLGYVTLPHHRVLRTKTRRRMFKKLRTVDPGSYARTESYLGMLQHANAWNLSKKVIERGV